MQHFMRSWQDIMRAPLYHDLQTITSIDWRYVIFRVTDNLYMYLSFSNCFRYLEIGMWHIFVCDSPTGKVRAPHRLRMRLYTILHIVRVPHASPPCRTRKSSVHKTCLTSGMNNNCETKSTYKGFFKLVRTKENSDTALSSWYRAPT